MNVKIIQASYPHTGSTVVVNALYGLISPDSPVIIGGSKSPKAVIDNNLIIKTHNVDVGFWKKKYPNYDLYFIMSERDQKYPPHYYKSSKVLIIPYGLILEPPQNSLKTIINKLYNRVDKLLPKGILLEESLAKRKALERITKMNKRYQAIQKMPFTFVDPFYHIHGHHRNRWISKEITGRNSSRGNFHRDRSP